LGSEGLLDAGVRSGGVTEAELTIGELRDGVTTGTETGGEGPLDKDGKEKLPAGLDGDGGEASGDTTPGADRLSEGLEAGEVTKGRSRLSLSLDSTAMDLVDPTDGDGGGGEGSGRSVPAGVRMLSLLRTIATDSDAGTTDGDSCPDC
tara:strand:+ start:2118 stop:2561 length:444 start_codon:yes stop_codon:yes gene_type:complete